MSVSIPSFEQNTQEVYHLIGNKDLNTLPAVLEDGHEEVSVQLYVVDRGLEELHARVHTQNEHHDGEV